MKISIEIEIWPHTASDPVVINEIHKQDLTDIIEDYVSDDIISRDISNIIITVDGTVY